MVRVIFGSLKGAADTSLRCTSSAKASAGRIVSPWPPITRLRCTRIAFVSATIVRGSTKVRMPCGGPGRIIGFPARLASGTGRLERSFADGGPTTQSASSTSGYTCMPGKLSTP